MIKVPITILCAALMALAVFGCANKADDFCERHDRDYGLRDLWDRKDCPHGHGFILQYREFFDPDDFGRGRDSLYGSPRDWRDDDYTRFRRDDYCLHGYDRHHHGWHGRHARTRFNEDAVSERYAPAMVPDREFNE